ncbi:MAG TPA: hypothetical protein VI815_04625 [Candidatus Nanoarchaeia archaeon]|nr:hypothetical protein [Candidatus Nanoarchaeia archaeon]
MKIITYDKLSEKIDWSKKYNPGWDKPDLFRKIEEKYGLYKGYSGWHSELATIDAAFSLVGGNKTFLDLGCGSNSRHDTFDEVSRFREPWLCRALSELGVKVIGIDIGNLDGEEFEHYSLNLLNENALSFLPDNSIDIAHEFQFFDSPFLHDMISITDKELAEKVKNPEIPYWSAGDHSKYCLEITKRVLIPQLQRIVKPDGYFVTTEVEK